MSEVGEVSYLLGRRGLIEVLESETMCLFFVFWLRWCRILTFEERVWGITGEGSEGGGRYFLCLRRLLRVSISWDVRG